MAFDIPRISGRAALSRRSVSQSGFYVIPGLYAPRGILPANPRRYWLTAQALFAKLSKLFQLNQLVRVPCNTRTLCNGWLTSCKPAPILAFSAGTFCETSKTIPAWGAFDFGTSPHGLSASSSRSHQETSGKAGARFPAKPVLTVGELPPVVQAHERRNVVPRLRRAPAPEELHRLELTEQEFLHAYFAVEHERNRTRRAICQGKAMPQDLQCTDGLWDKLQAVMFARMKGGQA